MYANLYHCAIDLQSSLPTICAFYVCLGHSAKLCTFYEQQQVENRVLLYSTIHTLFKGGWIWYFFFKIWKYFSSVLHFLPSFSNRSSAFISRRIENFLQVILNKLFFQCLTWAHHLTHRWARFLDVSPFFPFYIYISFCFGFDPNSRIFQ